MRDPSGLYGLADEGFLVGGWTDFHGMKVGLARWTVKWGVMATGWRPSPGSMRLVPYAFIASWRVWRARVVWVARRMRAGIWVGWRRRDASSWRGAIWPVGVRATKAAGGRLVVAGSQMARRTAKGRLLRAAISATAALSRSMAAARVVAKRVAFSTVVTAILSPA
jgi:hypothetical protein